MLRCLSCVVVLCCVFVQGVVSAEDKTTKAMVDVGELNEAYVTAFNDQNTKDIAACFSESADFTLLTGGDVQGREQIRAAHDSFFKNNPNAKIEGKQETYRLIRSGIVLAAGTWKVTAGPSEYPSSGQWFTVVVKQDGKWHYEAMRLMIPVK